LNAKKSELDKIAERTGRNIALMGMRSKFFFFIYDTLLFFFLFLMMFYDDITTILSHYFPGLAALCVQWGLMARLTWWEYSWDVMEPISVRNLIFIFFFFFQREKKNIVDTPTNYMKIY